MKAIAEHFTASVRHYREFVAFASRERSRTKKSQRLLGRINRTLRLASNCSQLAHMRADDEKLQLQPIIFFIVQCFMIAWL